MKRVFSGGARSTDLNYCGTHEPCKNGGTCESPAPDEYVCKCPEGFSGVNCEMADNICATGPCRNGGTCSVVPSTANNPESFKCSCRPGWTGDTCQMSKSSLSLLVSLLKSALNKDGTKESLGCV